MTIIEKRNLAIDVHVDGPTLVEMNEFKDAANGFTFNPTLFRQLGVTDYFGHCERLSEMEKEKSISLEVFGDDYRSMITQAEKLSSLGSNIYVKVPITFTNGKSTIEVLKHLSKKNIKVNVTAVFTIEQIKSISAALEPSNTIISIFAGRLFDIGLDAQQITSDIVEWNKKSLGASVLWASPRQIYDLILANKVGCDIITIPPSTLRKLKLFGKSPLDYSLETVKMFYEDSLAAGFEM